MAVAYEYSKDIERNFWDSRKILTHIHQSARARRVGPWPTLAATMMRFLCAVPPCVVLPPIVGGRVSLNSIAALVGRSGDGKGGAVGTSRDAVPLRTGELKPIKLGSGEGLSAAYVSWVPDETDTSKKKRMILQQHTTSVFFDVPEIDAVGAQASRGGATLMPELRCAYMGEGLGFQNRSQEARLHVYPQTYRMGVILGVQPERAMSLLSPNEVAAGTPQRVWWVSVLDRDAPDTAPDLPMEIMLEIPDENDLTVVGPSLLRDIPVCSKAVTEIDKNRLARMRGEDDALDGHILLCQEKAAVALALLESRWDIQDEDWDLARVFIAHSNMVRDQVQYDLRIADTRANVAVASKESQREDFKEGKALKRNTEWVLARLKKHTSQTSGELRVAMAYRERASLNSLLVMMVEAGQIELVGTKYQIASGS